MATEQEIFVAGTNPLVSGAKNEETYVGKGVSYCAECDAGFFKNKKVAIIGNGVSVTNAIKDLSNFVTEIVIFTNKTNNHLNDQNISSTKNLKISKVLYQNIDYFYGEPTLKGIYFYNEKNVLVKIEVDGLFIVSENGDNEE